MKQIPNSFRHYETKKHLINEPLLTSLCLPHPFQLNELQGAFASPRYPSPKTQISQAPWYTEAKCFFRGQQRDRPSTCTRNPTSSSANLTRDHIEVTITDFYATFVESSFLQKYMTPIFSIQNCVFSNKECSCANRFQQIPFPFNVLFKQYAFLI